MRILFIAAHADDIEVACPNTVKMFIDRGDEVMMALATCDEYAWLYGKQRSEFKGARQAQIRINEMNRVARAYGIDAHGMPHLNLHWLGWIDGYVPLTRDAFKKMCSYLTRVDADIVFAPDGYFSQDHHNDHDNTGLLACIACMSLKRRPLLFLWQSWKNDTYFPVRKPSFTFIPVYGHATQFPRQRLFVKFAKVFWWILVTLRRARSDGILAEAFRKVTFLPGENVPLSIKDRVKHTLSRKLMAGPPRSIYLPEPTSLGLHVDNEIVYENWFDYKSRKPR